jgi:uncharacterized protein YbjT (DUF2867 family)
MRNISSAFQVHVVMTQFGNGPSTTPGGVFAVVGATGQQGGATARALLNAGSTVRALVRDTGSTAAKALAQAGAQLGRADLEDAENLRAAFAGVDGVFAMTTMTGPGGTDEEVRHGRTIGDAARDAGVPHVVYSSVGGAERATGIPHFESKRRVEEHLLELGLSTTFVRPTFFMENFASGPQEEDGTLVLRSPLAPGVPLQMVAVEDIAAVAAAVLRDPAATPGGSVEIAGDELTGEQIAAAFGVRAGKPARFEPLPLDVLGDDEDMRAMFAWFRRLPAYEADFAATRRLSPGVKDFATWVAEHTSTGTVSK